MASVPTITKAMLAGSGTTAPASDELMETAINSKVSTGSKNRT